MPLSDTAHQLMTPAKGILASDERISSLNSKFLRLSIPQSPEMRRKLRELFINTPGIEKYLSGIILAEDTVPQTDSNDVPFTEILKQKGILIGVKLDQGTINLPMFPGETITAGLDDLESKLKFYKNLGVAFAKWRAVIHIGDGIPTETCLSSNAHLLALYAGMCQTEGIVPIIEPEVLMEGTHSLERAEQETLRTLQATFREIDRFRIDPEGLILKTSMVIPGSRSGEDVTPEEVAKRTVGVLKLAVPEDVAGIVFLSGGQSTQQATLNLNALAQYHDLPWPLTFSFNRAIEQPALEVWRGDDANRDPARQAFLDALKKEVCAELGQYPNRC